MDGERWRMDGWCTCEDGGWIIYDRGMKDGRAGDYGGWWRMKDWFRGG